MKNQENQYSNGRDINGAALTPEELQKLREISDNEKGIICGIVEDSDNKEYEDMIKETLPDVETWSDYK
jgi:hypothetical protein